MSWSHVLLGMSGRSTRKQFWLGHLLLYVLLILAFGLIVVLGNAIGAFPQDIPAAFNPDAPQLPPMPTDPASLALIAAGGIAFVAATYSSIAIAAKRLHDRGKSAWWLVLMFLLSFVLVGTIWYLIELGFLEGQPADNKYGEDPLAQWRTASAPEAF